MSNPASPRFLDRTSAPHIATLVVASAFGPIALNVFLPALPMIARHFEVDYAYAQLALPLYLAATAFFQLIVGSLSDQYGRRPIMIGSIMIALIATLVVIYAPTIEVFLAARVFQAFAITGMAIGRASIRDVVDTDAAASRIGYVTMGMTVAPMIAPVIGGYLSEKYDWQATFWLVFAFGLLTLFMVWRDMGETNRSLGRRFSTQLQAYPILFRSRRFWGYVATSGMASGAFFGFLGGAPYLAVNHFELSPSVYGGFFALVACGYFLGNFLSGRFSIRVGLNKMMLIGGMIASAGMVIALALELSGFDNVWIFFSAATFIGIGNGVTLPNANAGVVSVRPQVAGAASGLGGFLQIGAGAAISVLAGMLVGPATGPIPLIVLMLVASFLSALAAYYVILVARSLGEEASAP